jgi:hypothetical protein
MTINTEQNLRDFAFWAGGHSNAILLTSSDLDSIEEVLAELYPDGINDSHLNDLFWFDFETVLSWVGLRLEDDQIIR